MKAPMPLSLLLRLCFTSLILLGLNGCIVSTVVGTVVDVGVEVVKVPFKVGKGVYDAVSDDDEDEKKK